MNRGHPVHAVASHHGQTGHVYLTVLNDGQGAHPFLVVRVLMANVH